MADIDPTKKEIVRKLFPEFPDGHFEVFLFYCLNFSRKEIARYRKVSEKTIVKMLRQCCEQLEVTDPEHLRPILSLRIFFYHL